MIGNHQFNTYKRKVNVIRTEAWSRNILALNPHNNWSESSTLFLASRLSSSQLSNCIPSTRNKHSEQTYNKQAKQSTTKNTSLNKEKYYKSAPKKRAQSYDRKSARNTEDETTVKKKQLS